MTRCLTDNIATTPHRSRMGICDSCPFIQRDMFCWHGMYTTVDPVTYQLRDGRQLTILPGFCFDGASIPRLLWGLIGNPMESDYQAAALLHDFLYHSHLLSKADADLALLDVLEQCGVPMLRRKTIYWAVRLCGGSSYAQPAEVIRHFGMFGKVEEACVSAATETRKP